MSMLSKQNHPGSFDMINSLNSLAPAKSSADKKVSTELYVWGNDQFGQLGLGHKYMSASGHDKKKYLQTPKSCSFSIQITDIACGEDFAFLLTSKGLLYAMGSN